MLEEAGLVVTRRRGRQKLHFLNPVPIRLVHDRWVSKYAEPWGGAPRIKAETGAPDGKGVRDIHPHHARAPVGGHHRPRDPGKYNFGAAVNSDWTAGSRWGGFPGRGTLGDGEVLEVDPPRRLVHTMAALWGTTSKPRGRPG